MPNLAIKRQTNLFFGCSDIIIIDIFINFKNIKNIGKRVGLNPHYIHNLLANLYLCKMNFSSKLLENAVDAFASLPGIGRKTALRLALHILDQPEEYAQQYVSSIFQMKKDIKICEVCFNISDVAECSICSDKSRDDSTICVVESIRDLMAIEQTGQYRGLYHVLGGVISPIEGIGPEDLTIEEFLGRVNKGVVKEVIMAVSPTIEGDTTIFFLSKQLKAAGVNVSTISRGVAFGGELEYADGITLGRSIAARIPYQLQEGI